MPGKQIDTTQLITDIQNGDRFALSKAITLIESKNPTHRAQAITLLEKIPESNNETIRIAITGSPGAGKSTFIESFGQYLIKQGKKVAILAIDPSSQLSKGSILGDKTRMQSLSHDPNAYIRPSPAGETLGGVAQHTRETIVLCEKAGYDVVLIETVGVGQSEYEVAKMVDFFMLLLIPGSGDRLQGLKRGIVEMADLVFVNKADGDRAQMAKLTQAEFQNALHLYPARSNGWAPQVITGSALESIGVDDCWEQIKSFVETVGKEQIIANRRRQNKHWFEDRLADWLKDTILSHKEVNAAFVKYKERIDAGQLNVSRAIEQMQLRIKQLLNEL